MLSKEDVAALPAGSPVWLVGTRDPEGQEPWRTTVSRSVMPMLAYGEWVAFRAEIEARAWHYDRLSRWARAESARLLAVARAADKKAKVLR